MIRGIISLSICICSRPKNVKLCVKFITDAFFVFFLNMLRSHGTENLLSVFFTYSIKGHFHHLIKYIKPLRAIKFSTVPMAICYYFIGIFIRLKI